MKHMVSQTQKILFIMQPNERKVFDQGWLEYELLEKHQIHVISQTLADLASPHPPTLHARPHNQPRQPNTSLNMRIHNCGASYTPSNFPTSAYYDTSFFSSHQMTFSSPPAQAEKSPRSTHAPRVAQALPSI
ncbi:hypothetical protein DFH29DRAFT_81411 [Suillus ampliporus]|nr:hypothetical protein DFH29DRAFT_81411 [Suillus ampliporus]